jgi:uracil-DNA glycosylase family 4
MDYLDGATFVNAVANNDPRLTDQYPFYPLTSPGMPFPGKDFEAEAIQLGDEAIATAGTGNAKQVTAHGHWLTWLYVRALYDRNFEIRTTVKGRPRQAPYVLGHLWGCEPGMEDGPRPSDVMIVGKHPGDDEVQQGRNFVGPSSEPIARAIQELNIPDAVYGSWYLTNLVRHPRLDPGSSALAAAWIKNCLPLLHQELKLVRPKYMLLLGTEAAKAILGKTVNVTNMYGRTVDYKVALHEAGQTPEYHTVKVMVGMHPAAVFHKPENYDEFRDSFSLFWSLVNGAKIGEAEPDINHIDIYTERHLARVVDELLAAGYDTFAVDAEWHGDAPGEGNAYLRTIQVSWAVKCAFNIVLRHAGGAPGFLPSMGSALPHLQRLLKTTRERPTRVGGHFFRSDLPWLYDYGLDLRTEYACPGHKNGVPGWERMKQGVGGFDTGLLLHAVFETGPFGLEHNAARLCGVPRYDVALRNWKEKWCKDNNAEPKDLEGYGECPAEVLYPYGNYDADATFRLLERLEGTEEHEGLLDCDAYGLDSWQACWQAHRSSLAFLEMEMAGIVIDRGRGDDLTASYIDAKEARLKELQELARWPGFNPNSVTQCRELLFGHMLNGTVDNTNEGTPKRLRPPGAACLGLTPVKASGKGAKPWERLVAAGETHNYNPSTDKETLGILGQNEDNGPDGAVVLKLRDVRFIAQVLRSVLRVPKTDESTGVIVRDDEGNRVYEKGLMACIWSDGRVHTHLFQTKETGRASSARPPLQNISKRREADYARILGDSYKYPIRSLLRAAPGYVLIEADLKSAEMAAIAWTADDPQMIDDVRRNCLAEDDPEFLDMHSQMAVGAFRLNCEPTKDGLKAAGKKHMRVAAKNVNFGIPYQRGAEAIARQCREEGAMVSIIEAEALKDAYFTRYPRVYDLLEACKLRPQSPGWMAGAFKRYRRFAQTDDPKVMGEQQRQACNFPIQNMVADAISEACYHLSYYRMNRDVRYRQVLQIHDAVLFEVPIPHIAEVVEEVIPTCMCDRVPIRPCTLDGVLLPVQPRKFGIDVELFLNWGIAITEEQAREQGIPLEYI